MRWTPADTRSVPLRPLVLAFALTAACAGPSVAGRIDGDAVAITVRGAPFATVQTAAEPRPFVFPLLGPGGVAMTRCFPMAEAPNEERDHPHHQSLWFAHGAVDGADFWQGKAHGERQQRDGAPVVTTEADGCTVRCRYRWLADATTLLAEERALHFGADAADQLRWIDVDVTLRAGDRAVRLGDTKEGTFALRVHPALRVDGKVATGTLVDSEGRTNGAVWGKRARWIDDHGTIDGRAVGIAMFDHPDNLRHPTWWHARTYGLLAANPFGVHDFERAKAGTGDFELAAGATLRLRYRVLLHGDGFDAARLDAEWQRWAAAQ